MTQMTQDVEHGRVELLLPWYVNETLDAEEYESVRRHVEACAECRENFMLLNSLSDVVQEDSTIPIIPEPVPDKLLALVERETAGKGHDPFRGWRGVAAAAAVLLLVVLGRMATTIDESEPGYLTATSVESRGSYVLSMQFDTELAVTTRERILERLGATNVVATDLPGEYRFNVVRPNQTVVEFDAYLSSIEAMDGVAGVALVGIDDPGLQQ